MTDYRASNRLLPLNGVNAVRVGCSPLSPFHKVARHVLTVTLQLSEKDVKLLVTVGQCFDNVAKVCDIDEIDEPMPRCREAADHGELTLSIGRHEEAGPAGQLQELEFGECLLVRAEEEAPTPPQYRGW